MDDTQIRHAVDMLDLVATKVDLQSIGERFHVGLCPFHDEVEPSFVVDPTLRTYYCFGCRTSGDCFDWAWEMEGLNRAFARVWLTERFGAPEVSPKTPVPGQVTGESLAALLDEVMPRLAMHRPVSPARPTSSSPWPGRCNSRGPKLRSVWRSASLTTHASCSTSWSLLMTTAWR